MRNENNNQPLECSQASRPAARVIQSCHLSPLSLSGMECPLRLLSDWRAMGRRRPFTTNLLMEPALQSSLVAGCLACVAPRHFLMPVSPKQILPVGGLPSWGQVVLSPNERTSSFPENRVVPPVSPVSTPSRCGDRSEWPFLLTKPHSRGRGSSASHSERPSDRLALGGWAVPRACSHPSSVVVTQQS